MMKLKIKRVYQAADSEDGYRILIDRLWPRGISKEKGMVDLWAKEIAPSQELRKWYDHVSERYEAFVDCYEKELNKNERKTDFLNTCIEHLKSENVTLLYAAKSERENNAIVVQNWIIKCVTCCYDNIHVDKQTV